MTSSKTLTFREFANSVKVSIKCFATFVLPFTLLITIPKISVFLGFESTEFWRLTELITSIVYSMPMIL